MLSVANKPIMLSVIMPNVVMVNVVAPLKTKLKRKMRFFFGWDQNRNKIQAFLDRGGAGLGPMAHPECLTLCLANPCK